MFIPEPHDIRIREAALRKRGEDPFAQYLLSITFFVPSPGDLSAAGAEISAFMKKSGYPLSTPDTPPKSSIHRRNRTFTVHLAVNESPQAVINLAHLLRRNSIELDQRQITLEDMSASAGVAVSHSETDDAQFEQFMRALNAAAPIQRTRKGSAGQSGERPGP